jgi:uncharacterized protein YlzI (FlbEa/FlbD family)
MQVINPLIALVLLLFLSQCKAKKEPNNQPSIVDLAYQIENIKLNPDQALLLVKSIKISQKEETQEMEARVISLDKQSFGFNSFLKSGDIILIQSNEIKLIEDTEYALIVEENRSMNQDKSAFRLIKIVK